MAQETVIEEGPGIHDIPLVNLEVNVPAEMCAKARLLRLHVACRSIPEHFIPSYAQVEELWRGPLLQDCQSRDFCRPRFTYDFNMVPYKYDRSYESADERQPPSR